MKLKIIVGSNRKQSNSSKIADIITQRCQNSVFEDIDTLDLAKIDVPFWDEEYWTKSERWAAIKENVIAPMRQDHAFVVITPEYSGMASAMLKNLFLLCSPRELGHKPALIVSVSSGIGGSYPVAELRMSSYKNTRLCYLPDHIIVRQADEFDAKSSTSARLSYCLDLLGEYAKALTQVRESGVINTKDFPHGL